MFHILTSIPRGLLVDCFQAWGNLVVLWSIQSIVVYRISAMYTHTRTIRYLLLAFFAIEIAATVPMQAISGGTHPGVPISIPGVQLCEPRVYERWYYLFWLPILVFEFLMLGLSIFKALQYRATTYHAEKILYELSGRQSLKFILLRDSIVFPFLAFCGCLLNLIGWRVFSSTATQINLGIAGFGARIFGCQLVLSLREAYYRPFDEECSQVRPKLPSIIFVHTSRESMEEGSIV
ncbi:hypothetical protein B0H34DRAFT_660932 [Crassisporium funariophilum]|nr:hypothetical protein B0H34DRAFT_660932 [Crassisporium funariophilum]